MCGIFGYIGQYDKRVYEFLRKGFIDSESRGRDATGFFAIDGRGKLVLDKRPIRAKKFVNRSKEFRSLYELSTSLFIGHCRAATTGCGTPKENRNNHPFMGKHTALVHNGYIPNFKNEYKALNLRTDTDSEVILRIIDDEIAKNISPIAAIEAVVKNTPSYAAIATAVALLQERQLLLYKNDKRPLWFATTDAGLVFSSTDTILKESLKSSGLKTEQVIEMQDHTAMLVSAEAGILEVKSFKKEPTVVSLPSVVSPETKARQRVPTPQEMVAGYEFAKWVMTDAMPSQKEIEWALSMMKE